jgi:hypothetical protein
MNHSLSFCFSFWAWLSQFVAWKIFMKFHPIWHQFDLDISWPVFQPIRLDIEISVRTPERTVIAHVPDTGYYNMLNQGCEPQRKVDGSIFTAHKNRFWGRFAKWEKKTFKMFPTQRESFLNTDRNSVQDFKSQESIKSSVCPDLPPAFCLSRKER